MAGDASAEQRLARAMQRAGISERDLEERFIRSAGPGGQNVNKVASCVVLRHRPSGLEIRCQQERSQAANRLLARWQLIHRLEAKQAQQRHEQQSHAAKLRAQKRRRSGAAQHAVLESKRRRSRTKALRRAPSSDE